MFWLNRRVQGRFDSFYIESRRALQVHTMNSIVQELVASLTFFAEESKGRDSICFSTTHKYQLFLHNAFFLRRHYKWPKEVPCLRAKIIFCLSTGYLASLEGFIHPFSKYDSDITLVNDLRRNMCTIGNWRTKSPM
jgi:hypothetical protein